MSARCKEIREKGKHFGETIKRGHSRFIVFTYSGMKRMVDEVQEIFKSVIKETVPRQYPKD